MPTTEVPAPLHSVVLTPVQSSAPPVSTPVQSSAPPVSTPVQLVPPAPVSTPVQSAPSAPVSTPMQSLPPTPVSTPTPLPWISINTSLDNSGFNFPPSSILGGQSENSQPTPLFTFSPSFSPDIPQPQPQPAVLPTISSFVEAPINNRLTPINFHISGAQIPQDLVVVPPIPTTPGLTPAQKALHMERQEEAERNAGKPCDRSAGLNPDGTQKARPKVNVHGKTDAVSSAPAKHASTSVSVSGRAEKRSKK
ncbi:hypothetical protein H0H92_002379 [Tricholoma furcatifolium]|nr:hypothetical protein H0H92_002379 [Tricholoma furcatifolium]